MMKHWLTRREVLTGLVTIPALGTLLTSARAAAAGVPLPKFVFLYYGNGAHPQWTPPANGAAFGALPPFMQPLEAVRGDIAIIKNLMVMHVGPVGHNTGTMSMLTGVDAALALGNNGLGQADITSPKASSLDQVLSLRIAGSAAPTPLGALNCANLALPNTNAAGGRLSFSATTPIVHVPPDRDPFQAFTKVLAKFVPEGSPMGDPQAQARLLAKRQSILDGVRGDVARLKSRVGASDQAHLDSYLTALREVELGFSQSPPPPPPPPNSACSAAPPAPGPGMFSQANLANHGVITRRHFDVIGFALGCGLTRVATMQLSDGSLNYDGLWAGLTTDCHGVSHYATNPNPAACLADISKLQAYWMSQFVNMVNKLKSLPDVTGTVLDNSMLVMATQNGDSASHPGINAPFIVAGGASGRLAPGGRLIDAQGRAQNDLLVRIAHVMGFSDITRFGTASLNHGPLPGLWT